MSDPMRAGAAQREHQFPSSLWAALEAQVKIRPGKIAYRILDSHLREQGTITFANLQRCAEAGARWLADRGLAGRPIVLFQPTSLDFIVSFFAVLRGGGAVIPLNPRLTLATAKQLHPILKDAAPAAILGDRFVAERLKRATGGIGPVRIEVMSAEDLSLGLRDGVPRPAVHSSATAVIQYTSGSTNAPKGVCVTHANLLANAYLLTETFAASSDDVAVSWLPFFHDMGLMTGLVWPVTAGASAVLMKSSTFSARPMTWLKALSEWRGTISAGPNFAYQLCADRAAMEETSNLDLSPWRVAICGAEPVNPDTVEQFTQRFATARFDPCCLFPSYGLAEATLFVSGGRPKTPPRTLEVDARLLEQQGIAVARDPGAKARRLVACGAPASNLDVRIVDPQTSLLLPVRTVGEIWVRGPSVSAGYLGLDGLNAEVFGASIATDVAAQPYLRTGDLGFLDQGELFVVGRLKDLIIVRGAKHAPQDLELTCAQAHKSLAGCRGIAFALDDEPDGGIVILHEVPRALEDQASTIMELLRGAVAQSHGVAPHAVVLLPLRTLPLTSSGKVRRGPTRSAWLAGELPVIASWRASD